LKYIEHTCDRRHCSCARQELRRRAAALTGAPCLVSFVSPNGNVEEEGGSPSGADSA
jgi:hypothetical protein